MMETAKADAVSPPAGQRLGLMLAVYAAITIMASVLLHLSSTSDYVGTDNDDVMRLVEVRDFLSGQGWFDLTQHRLGLEGGTPMHWSRLIDLPIAVLISFFILFLDPLVAEAWALTLWPLLLIVPLLGAMGLAGQRAGGALAMHVAFGLTALLVLGTNRFQPGSIDHHNAQLVLIAVLAAALTDPRRSVWSFTIAGIAAATAISIGAETMPLVVTACGIVAVIWAVAGDTFAPATRSFMFALAGALSLFFFSTTPPHLYPVVTCDSLSIGYFGLALIGAGLLVLSTFLARGQKVSVRLAALGVNAVLVVAAALFLAPKCLRSPLADLDPMLVSDWLANVAEAQSVLDEARIKPGLLGGHYAVGLFAIAVCVFRLMRREHVPLHATLLPLLVVAWGVALVQVRGAIFANLLAVIPLSLLIAELRSGARRNPRDLRAGLALLACALVSVPSFWFVAGAMTTEGAAGLGNRAQTVRQGGPSRDCISERGMA
ncbi:MAG TPA: hypothetical protein VFV70_11840, partial [Hyphomonadaceae bacterium]|nr:hypothetical protein [Hyphomonadaceae bacterium]